jgi:hypothetical protein
MVEGYYTAKKEWPMQLWGSSSAQRVLVLRDFTSYTRWHRHDDSPIFRYANDTCFLLKFNPQTYQPGNAVYFQIDDCSPWTPWAYDDVFNLDLFQMISNDCIVKVMRHSRRTGEPITADQILNKDPPFRDCYRHNNLKRSVLEKMANELNHLTLLWDFEIARHLQQPFNNIPSQKYAELPMGFGVALVLQQYGGKNFKQMIFELFTGSACIRS